MAQPTAYNRVNNFQSQLGTTHGTNLDSEFDAVELTLDEILTNLALIQRDDGKIANASVHQDAFDTTALAIMAATWVPQGAWTTATQYDVGDVVEESHSSYVCTTAHLSNVFSSDRTLGYWTVVAFAGTLLASEIAFTPTGNVTATTVQAAIAEVDSEKQTLDATLTALAGVTTAADKLIYATGADAFSTTDLSAFGRSLIDDAAASNARTTLGLGTLATLSTVGTSQIDDDSVTFAKMQNVATGILLGRSTASTGDIETISIGTGLTLSGGTLSASAANALYLSIPGTYYIPIPSSVVSNTMYYWGTGSGGGGGNSNSGTGKGGSAGGSAAHILKANRRSFSVSGISFVKVVIGAGGLTQAGAGANGLDGSTTSITFGGTTETLNAGGGGTGGGGTRGAAGSAGTGQTAGAVGGLGAQGAGVSGGGSGAAQATAGTDNATNAGVAGATGYFGNGGASQAITAVGLPGNGAGCGGGGGSGGNSEGGVGGPGLVVLEW